MRPEVNSNRSDFKKIQFGLLITLLYCLHNFARSETHFTLEVTSVQMTELKSQTGVRFSCKQSDTEVK